MLYYLNFSPEESGRATSSLGRRDGTVNGRHAEKWGGERKAIGKIVA